MVDVAAARAWVEGYERAWRTPGTGMLGELFAPDAVYSPSPWAGPVVGLPAIARFWEDERSGPDEQFTLVWEPVALDEHVAVVRTSVSYAEGAHLSWRNLWVLHLDRHGLCHRFEEWPFEPGQPDGHDRPTG